MPGETNDTALDGELDNKKDASSSGSNNEINNLDNDRKDAINNIKKRRSLLEALLYLFASYIEKELPQVREKTMITSTIKHEFVNPAEPREIDISGCRLLHVLLNDIIQGLTKLTLLIDHYKDDQDILYFVEDVKSHCHKLLFDINEVGLTILSQENLRSAIRSLEFKLTTIVSFIELELGVVSLLDPTMVERTSIIIINNFVEFAKQGRKYYEMLPKDQFWTLDENFSSALYVFLLRMTKILTQYYFIIRSSNLNLRELVFKSIFHALYYVFQIRNYIDFDRRIVTQAPEDVVNLCSQFLTLLSEVLGYVSNYRSFNKKYEISVEKLRNIKVFVSDTCPFCNKFFKTNLYEVVLERAAMLHVGVEVIDKDADKESSATHLFYNIATIPSLLFPHLYNNYRRFEVIVQDDKDLGISQTIRKINYYLFGPLYNLTFSQIKLLEKLPAIQKLFELNPSITKEEILVKLGDDSKEMLQTLISQGVLFTTDLSNPIPKYQLNSKKLIILENNLKNSNVLNSLR